MNIPKGYKLVPTQITEAMREAALGVDEWAQNEGQDQWKPGQELIWEELLAAAPAPPQPIYDEAKERELFEAFVVNFHHGAKLTGYVHDDPDYPVLNGQFLYEDWDVQSAWAVWQKCAQSRAKAGDAGHE